MIELIVIFLVIGSLTIGGGLVAIPLIQAEVVEKGIISVQEFILMIGVAESTPGPIGINIATFVGFSKFGIFGAILTTFAFVLPSFVLLSLVFNVLKKYRHTVLVNAWLMFLKAAVTGLILYASISLFESNIMSSEIPFDFKTIGLFVLTAIIGIKLHKKPIYMVLAGAVFGFILFSL